MIRFLYEKDFMSNLWFIKNRIIYKDWIIFETPIFQIDRCLKARLSEF